MQAQQLLWAASQAYDEEQSAADLRTRQLVCQRYRPADLPALQVGDVEPCRTSGVVGQPAPCCAVSSR